jgi:hypothetical protein
VGAQRAAAVVVARSVHPAADQGIVNVAVVALVVVLLALAILGLGGTRLLGGLLVILLFAHGMKAVQSVCSHTTTTRTGPKLRDAARHFGRGTLRP